MAVPMSLSPRPLRLTRIVASGPLLVGQLPGQAQRAGDRVGRLDRRDDALGAAEQRHRLHGLGVGDRQVGRPPGRWRGGRAAGRRRGSPARPRSSATRRSGRPRPGARRCGRRAAPRARRRDGGGVPAGLDAVAAGLEAVDLHVGVVEERGEQADRVGPAADAGRDRVRQPRRTARGTGRGPRRRCRG